MFPVAPALVVFLGDLGAKIPGGTQLRFAPACRHGSGGRRAKWVARAGAARQDSGPAALRKARNAADRADLQGLFGK